MKVLLVFFCVCTIVLSDSVVTDDQLIPSLPLGVNSNDNEQCQSDSDLYVNSLKNLTLWAHEMLDATAKSTTGVLRGSVFNMGDFGQCLTARAPFPTRYCMATVITNMPRPKEERLDEISLYFNPNTSVLQRLYKYKDKTQQSRNVVNVGWCVPASCSLSDLEDSLNEHFNKSTFFLNKYNVTYTAVMNELLCQTAEEIKYFDGVDITFCCLCLFVAIIVVIGTIYDFGMKKAQKDQKPKTKGMCQKMLLGFSLKRNFVDLNRIDESNKALKILYGVKTVAICMIIIDHRCGTFTSSAILNFEYIEVQYRSALACIIFHGDLFVDTFFIFSGLLVAYGLLKQFDKKRMNPGYIILLRYIRLTPVYAFVIFYYATLFNHSGSGPFWKLIASPETKDCRANWWTNLLYVSNYVNEKNMCLVHSWYLPCDFHFFIIAIGLCMLIDRQKKFGLFSLLLVVIASMIIPFIITIVFNRPAMMFFYPDFLTGPKVHPDFLLTYNKSHTRATPYFLGMFTGYIYYRLKGTNTLVNKKKSYVIMLGSAALILISIFSGMAFYDPYHKEDVVEAAFYAALHRPAWAMGTIGLMYVASYGHARPLTKVLTWSPFIPLSKLVYGAYLIHMQFQLRSASSFENPRVFRYFDVIYLAVADIFLAFVSALVLYLTIEAPVKNVFRELLAPSRDPPEPKELVEQPFSVIKNTIENLASENYKDNGSSRL